MLFASAFAILNRLLPAEEASAHCDIPCGIYDPHLAQIAALTTVRMNQLIEKLPHPASGASETEHTAYHNSFARYIAVKERGLEHHEAGLQGQAGSEHAGGPGSPGRGAEVRRGLLGHEGRFDPPRGLPSGRGRRAGLPRWLAARLAHGSHSFGAVLATGAALSACDPAIPQAVLPR
jgi:hypothetical protein